MELYLVRHGLAVDLGEQGTSSDAERMLTAKGEKRTRRTAKALQELKCIPAKICTSPLVRAAQTADIICRILIPKKEATPGEYLKPDASIAAGIAAIRAMRVGSVILVGHMPHLSRLASAVLTGDEAALFLDFDKSGVCCIVWEGSQQKGGARLRWLLDSIQCRMIGS